MMDAVHSALAKTEEASILAARASRDPSAYWLAWSRYWRIRAQAAGPNEFKLYCRFSEISSRNAENDTPIPEE